MKPQHSGPQGLLERATGQPPAPAGLQGEGARAMAPVIRSTLCPFAVRARLRSAPAFDPAASLQENAAASAEPLIRFSREAERSRLDGFVYRFPVRYVGATAADLCVLTRTLVGTLMEHDPDNPREFSRDDVLADNWRFSFAGVDYFAPVFAPLYDRHHSRFTYDAADDIFVLMQPNSSFHARLGERPGHIRSAIRARFDRGAQPYPGYHVEAHKFVLPESAESEPLSWYDFDVPRSCGAAGKGLSTRYGQGSPGKPELDQAGGGPGDRPRS